MDSENSKLADFEHVHIKKLYKIFKKTIEEEQLMIDNLLNQPKEVLTKGQNISDKVANFESRWKFFMAFIFMARFYSKHLPLSATI